MILLARTTACLVLLVLAAGCRTAIDPMTISDAQTAARVKTALVNDPALGVRTIEVRVRLGAVDLSGRVLTQDEADRAVAIARGVSGVTAVGLDWVQAELRSQAGGPDILTRVQIKPIMLGAGYTIASERTSLSASVVGGYAWNSLTVTDTGSAAGLPVEVDNSLVWRPGVTLWRDVGNRTVLMISVGHVVTGLRLTVLNDGRLEKRSLRGDTTIVRAGVAYKLF
jgi:hypothetical protein